VDRQYVLARRVPADLDGVAQRVFARRLTHQTPIDCLLPLAQQVDHPPRAVHRRSFFIAGDEERQRAPMLRIASDEFLGGRHHGGEPALHVGRAAAIQQAVLHHRRERIGLPIVDGARGHHIRVPGEAEHGTARAAGRPKIVHGPEA
jgi:hypothetical protein